MSENSKEQISGTALPGGEIPEGAVPLFRDAYGGTAFIKNVPNPHLPKSTTESTVAPVYKSEREHRHMRTMTEARSFAKMDRPSEPFTGSERLSLGSIEKAMADGRNKNGPVRVSYSKDANVSSFMKNDWADFDRFRRRGV